MFTLQYYCGPSKGWIKGSARFPSKESAQAEVNSLRAAERACNASHLITQVVEA